MNLHNKIKSLKDDELDILTKEVWPEIFEKHIISLTHLGDMLRIIESCEWLDEIYLNKINSHLFKKKSIIIEDYKNFKYKTKITSASFLIESINRQGNIG